MNVPTAVPVSKVIVGSTAEPFTLNAHNMAKKHLFVFIFAIRTDEYNACNMR